jgi:RNA polymerase sigma-70 factor (ECF subfamily)
VADFDFRGEGSLKAWVTRIVANMAVSHLRRASRFEFIGDIPDELEPEEPDVGTIPMKILMDMIASLPTGYRTVFNLYVFEQLSHKQIARLLGIKESTSASQYLRAKRMMARKINEYKQHSL